MLHKMDNNAEQEAGESDQDAVDPGQILDDWLGELNILSEGLDVGNLHTRNAQLNQEITAPRIDSYRFSMANLEDSPDVDLDAILGELCALGCDYDREILNAQEARTNKRDSDKSQLSINQHQNQNRAILRQVKLDEDTMLLNNKTADRTDSPDNDSAFSDTVSMLSSESSASSGASTKPTTLLLLPDDASRAKAEKIRLAMEKIKEANIQKLFVKVFTLDGSAKSLLIDEKMSCAYVTRLLADKNHVLMDPKWALVEHLPDLFMERVYEDHELLVENLMLWTRESKNKVYFVERPDKVMLFNQPERFLLTDNKSFIDDEHSRNILLEEFFSSHRGPAGGGIPEMEGPLYLKSDSKKGWKKYHFVLRASGIYYVQKEKQKCTRDLVCLATFDVNQIYYGIGWKKKFKAPTDFCFAIKHPRLQEPKSTKYIKYLCAEDKQSLDRWMVGMRVAKVGKQVMDNYRTLVEELAQEDLDLLAHARSCSVTSIAQSNASSATTPSSQGYAPSEGYATQSEISSGRHSRASSSSSSGCMSDGATSSENAFDTEFPTGTIKRKPSMKPTIPLTNITRQLIQVGETCDEPDCAVSPTSPASSPVSFTNTGTLTRRHSSRRKSNSTDDSSTSGTLKRQHSYNKSSANRTSIDSLNNRASPCSPSFERSPVNSFVNNNMSDSIISLPPPPPPQDSDEELICANNPLPPPPEMYNSTTSLDSLPPPPNPCDLPVLDDTLTGSQLSLMSLPPLLQEPTTHRRRIDPTPTPNDSSNPPPPFYVNPPIYVNKNFANNGGLRSSLRHSHSSQEPIYVRRTSPPKTAKKISFNLTPQEVPALPRKPAPPRRSENTKLSSPKKLADPPIDFLKEIQRVMRKKWQVAQKCKEEPNTTPHEVLGFRDPPAILPDYKETNVSNWVQEHYGPNNFYENVYRDAVVEVPEYSSSSPTHSGKGRRPPPPPPKRSETTHLTTNKIH